MIAALPPPSADFCLSGRMPAMLPIDPPSLLLFAFQLVYSLRRRVIYTGRRGVGWCLGFPNGVGVGLKWWLWRGVAWWHDDVSSSLGGRSSLQDSDYLSGYCIPLRIRQFGQFPSKVYKGILDGVGWLSKKFYQPIFICGRQRQNVNWVDANIKSFIHLHLEKNLSCGCLICCDLFLPRLFLSYSQLPVYIMRL